MVGACHFSPSISDPEQAKLLACRRVGQIMVEFGIRKLELHTNNQTVAIMLRDRELNRSVHGMLVEELKRLLELLDNRNSQGDVGAVFGKQGSAYLSKRRMWT